MMTTIKINPNVEAIIGHLNNETRKSPSKVAKLGRAIFAVLEQLPLVPLAQCGMYSFKRIRSAARANLGSKKKQRAYREAATDHLLFDTRVKYNHELDKRIFASFVRTLVLIPGLNKYVENLVKSKITAEERKIVVALFLQEHGFDSIDQLSDELKAYLVKYLDQGDGAILDDAGRRLFIAAGAKYPALCPCGTEDLVDLTKKIENGLNEDQEAETIDAVAEAHGTPNEDGAPVPEETPNTISTLPEEGSQAHTDADAAAEAQHAFELMKEPAPELEHTNTQTLRPSERTEATVNLELQVETIARESDGDAAAREAVVVLAEALDLDSENVDV